MCVFFVCSENAILPVGAYLSACPFPPVEAGSFLVVLDTATSAALGDNELFYCFTEK